MLFLFCFVSAPILHGSMTFWNKYDTTICTCLWVKRYWDNVVSTATELHGLDNPELESPQVKVIYFFRKTLRRPWGPMKPPNQWAW